MAGKPQGAVPPLRQDIRSNGPRTGVKRSSRPIHGDITMTQKSHEDATPPWDAARVNLTSRELAPGVFAVMPDDVLAKDHVGTTAGFVIGERGVLVIESML